MPATKMGLNVIHPGPNERNWSCFEFWGGATDHLQSNAYVRTLNHRSNADDVVHAKLALVAYRFPLARLLSYTRPRSARYLEAAAGSPLAQFCWEGSKSRATEDLPPQPPPHRPPSSCPSPRPSAMMATSPSSSPPSPSSVEERLAGGRSGAFSPPAAAEPPELVLVVNANSTSNKTTDRVRSRLRGKRRRCGCSILSTACGTQTFRITGGRGCRCKNWVRSNFKSLVCTLGENMLSHR